MGMVLHWENKSRDFTLIILFVRLKDRLKKSLRVIEVYILINILR